MTIQSRRNFLRLTAATATLPMYATQLRAATEHTVIIKGFAFEPAELTIAAGDTVIFTNEDNAPHTATDDNGAFDTGRLNRGQSATLTFPAAGDFAYHCEFHRGMKATLTVA